MNGPYPPVLPPKPPNIGISHTVDVTSTGKSLRKKKTQQEQDRPELAADDNATSKDLSLSVRPESTNPRLSVFAESLEQTPSQIRGKPEPRIEPPGSAYRARRTGKTNPQIHIVSFLCEYPRARAQSTEPKRNLFQNLLRPSISERRLLIGSKQKTAAAVAARRTSDGRNYAQIVVKGLYEDGANKSTYQVNAVEGMEPKPKKSRSRGKRLGQEMVKTVKKRELIESVSGDGESAVVTSDEMADSIHRNLNDGKSKDEELREEREREKRRRERSPAPMLPLQKGVEGNFGIDFSSILKRHEEASASPKKPKRGSLNTSLMTRSESRPNVRDFAGEGSSNFIRSAFRRRSKSPTKKGPVNGQSPLKQSPQKRQEKQQDVKAELPKAPPPTPDVPDLSVYTRRINSIRDSVVQHTGLGALIPLVEPNSDQLKHSAVADGQTPSVISHNQQSSGSSSTARNSSARNSSARNSSARNSSARNSSTSNGHSKSPSGISAGSNEIDNLSEVSSAIISDAQSISIHKTNGSAEWGNGNLIRKPLRPGPAPTGPLPSLPEGYDVQQPSTPRRRDSTQGLSPERSPTKSRQKTQSRYRFTPADESATKVTQSPTRTKGEENTKKPAALVRIQTANLNDFPVPPQLTPEKTKRLSLASALSEKLPTSASDGTLGARAERTKKLKAKDLARERSKAPSLTDEGEPHLSTSRTMPSMATHGEGHKDSIDRLIDSYETQQVPNPWHRPQASLVSAFSNSTSDNRNSMRLSEISPIIVVADQEPIIPPKPLSMKTPSSEYANSYDNPASASEKHYSPNPPANEFSDSRPGSECSSQYPKPPDRASRRSIANRSPHKNIANRAPTPFSHPGLLRKDSHRSSHRSSFIEPDLEMRMAAMEKKNLLLERAFLAVMDASASISSGDGGSQGRDSGHSFGTGERYSGSAAGGLDHLNGGSGMRDVNGDRLYTGLEKLLVRHGSGRLSTLSTTSGPF